MFRLLLFSICVMLLLDEVIRRCNLCLHYDGFKCKEGMKSCWKINLLPSKKSCSTENYYFNDRYTGVYLFRYTTLSCKRCSEGMSQVFHDLLRETFCCTDKNKCNDGGVNLDLSAILYEDEKERKKKELNE